MSQRNVDNIPLNKKGKIIYQGRATKVSGDDSILVEYTNRSVGSIMSDISAFYHLPVIYGTGIDTASTNLLGGGHVEFIRSDLWGPLRMPEGDSVYFSWKSNAIYVTQERRVHYPKEK